MSQTSQEPQQGSSTAILTEVAESVAHAKLAFEGATAELVDAKEELNKAHHRLEAAIKHYEETRKAARG